MPRKPAESKDEDVVQFGSYWIPRKLRDDFQKLCARKETSMVKVLQRHMRIDLALDTIPTVEEAEDPSKGLVPNLTSKRKVQKQPQEGVASDAHG